MNIPIPVGLIGLGRHGSRYLQHLVTEETGGKLMAICRRHVVEGRQQAANHGIQFFPDYQDLIADSAIQAILVVTQPSLHPPIALEAIRHGKAILIEKPLALNSREGQEIVEAASQVGTPIMTGHTLRFEPVLRKIQNLGLRIGPWQSLSGTMHLEKRRETTLGTGHGVLFEFGIHLLDWVRLIMRKEPLTINANMKRDSPTSPENHAEISITTRSGLVCHLNIARASTKRITHIEIIGTKGRIFADWTNRVVQIFEQESLTFQEFLPPTPTILLLLQDFFRALRTGQPMPIPGEEGLRSVELVEACHQAANGRQPIYFHQ